MTRIGLVLALCLFTWAGAAQGASWSTYRDTASPYTIDLPVVSFRPTDASQPGHLALAELSGDAMIDVYGGTNTKQLSPKEFIDQLAHAPRIADISYRAEGRTWFAISGHYSREAGDAGTLIYYAKFVFSSDLSRFAAFEISYSVAEKSRMDPVVMRLEKSLKLLR
jgi:hypothetical protein